MNVKFVRWYLKVFSSFIFLLLLTSIIPAVTVIAVNHLNSPPDVDYREMYVYVKFSPLKPPETPIVKVTKPGFTVGYGEPTSYLSDNYTYFSMPEFLLGDAKKALAKSGFSGSIYVPISIGKFGGVLLPVNGSVSGPDCIVLGNESIERGSYSYFPIVMLSPISPYRDLSPQTVRIEKVEHILNVSPSLMPLQALMKENGIRCIASGELYESILRLQNLTPGLDNLLVTGFLMVFPNEINVSALYHALYQEFAPHSYYPELYIITKDYVRGVLFPEKRTEWKDVWASLLAFLPSIPLIWIVMNREKQEEEKMRKLLRVSGGNPVIVDILTFLFVGVAVLVVFLFTETSTGAALLIMLAALFAIRYYGGSFKPGTKTTKILLRAVTIMTSFVFAASSIYWFFPGRYTWAGIITGYTAYVLALPLKPLSDYIFELVGGTIFGYLPWISGSVLASLLIMQAFSRSGRIPHRITSRKVSGALAAMIIFTVFTGIALSSPITYTYKSTSAGNLGATILVQFTGSLDLSSPETFAEQEYREIEAYNSLTEAIKIHGGIYGTVWDVGHVSKGSGLVDIVAAWVSAYDSSLLDYLRFARSRSKEAQELYALFYSNSGKAMIYPRVLKEINTSGKWANLRLIPSYAGSEPTTIKIEYVPLNQHVPFGSDIFIPFDVAKAHNITPLPDLMFVYGGKEVLRAIEEVHKKYPGQFIYLSAENNIKEARSVFFKGEVAIPLIASAVMIPAVGLILGLRDAEELRKKKKLFTILGISKKELTPPLLAFLPLSLMTVPMLIDAARLYSLGFSDSVELFLVLSAPLVGVLLSPLMYIAAIWRWET